jgi:hypothetical protein
MAGGRVVEPFIGPILSGLISAVLAAVGCYVAVTNRLTKLETMIADLRADVERHNSLMERTYKAEQDITNIYHRVDRIEGRCERHFGPSLHD